MSEGLRRLMDDEYRSIVVQQWRDYRDTSWPKHKFETIVGDVMETLGRTDLNASAVCGQLLRELHERLAVTSREEDRAQVIYSYVEQRICERYPLAMPVTGRDLMDIGIPQSPLIGSILQELRVRFHKEKLGREELLQIARSRAAAYQASGMET